MATLTQIDILNELGGIVKYSNFKPSKETLHGNALLKHFNHTDVYLIT